MKYLTLKNKYYNVDKIITRKIKSGQKFYLIKWKGFSLEYCSWEPISHLTKILNIVEIFDNNFPDSIEKEEYAQFKKLYKKYNKKKLVKSINSKINIDKKTSSSNKIIINLEDLNINEIKEIKAEEGNKTDEISSVNTINEIEIKIDKEKESEIIDNNFEDINKCNISGGGKLIKPILVW